MAVMRAGYIGFPISTRNSPAAIAHLIGKTGTKFILTTPDAPTQALAEASIAALAEAARDGSGAFKPFVVDLPRFEELYPAVEPEHFDFLPDMVTPPIDTQCMVIHSSGSTAFPKPIPFTHRNMIETSKLFCE